MATKDNSSGLLSKVARFVRNPTTDWADLDNPVQAPVDAGYSKQALKEMIERKRQNDFVRRREFDQLRKLRSQGPAAINAEAAERPSFFQTSTASSMDGRAVTLKKIDDIEAQMSKQWWKGRQGESTAAPDDGAAVAPSAPPASDADSTVSTQAPGLAEPARDAHEPNFAVTQAADFGHAARAIPETHATGRQAASDATEFAATMLSPHFEAAGTLDAHDARVSVYRAEQSFDGTLGDGVTDPDLEESAIRFANGDDAGAEEGLVAALNGAAVPLQKSHTWIATLFDFYRATGQQGRFERARADFSHRFGVVAPFWFSMPDRQASSTAAAEEKTEPAMLDNGPIWTSPAEFTLASLDDLNLAVANAPSPWHLDWSPLTTVHADAGEPLGQVLAYWASAPLQLLFRGGDSLERTLRFHTPSDNRQVGVAWWRLRMDALRIMGLQDEFELAALDYCVTFEVSPPAWVDVRCDYRSDLSSTTIVTDRDELHPQEPAWSGDRDQAMTQLMSMDRDLPTASAILSGDILGDAADALAKLESARRGGDHLVISCANLMRVDFSAAGTLLNWVAQRQAEGCRVQFRDVHRLVAAFFHVIGIHEHARVGLRAD